MSLLARYRALHLKPSSANLSSVLHAVIDASPGQIPSDERKTLVKEILEDLQSKNSRLHAKDRPLALNALKTLGRSPDAAQIIATKPCLEFLLTIANVSLDVARMISNALILHASGRTNFVEVGGGDFALSMLSSNQNDTQILFLACRLLFLSTHDSGSVDFITRLMDKTNILEVTITTMDLLTRKLNSDPTAKDALTDLLKYVYNMIVHYSRTEIQRQTVLGEAWSDRFAVWVAPLLRTFGSLPFTMTPPTPLSSPMTHVVHCLLNVPVETYSSSWFPTRRSGSPSLTATILSPNSLTNRARSLFSHRTSTSSRSSSPASSSSSGNGGANANGSTDLVQRSYDLVQKCFEHYFPGAISVDAKEVRAKATSEGVALDELLAPPLLLLRKLVEADETSRLKIRGYILPDDLDRTNSLESRDDLLGRLIRLLSSVHHPRLQNCSGELLFAVCDSDSSLLSAQIGYGNAAGYLFNKGILSAPPASGGSRASGSSSRSKFTSDPSSGVPSFAALDINPITGVVDKPDEDPSEPMTEEEKEREAEKLFVLFDRLERAGVTQNPIRKALHEGKLEKYRE